MLSIVPLTSAMFPDIYDPLLADWNPSITRAMWQRVFTAPASSSDDRTGFAMLDDGRVVGVVGLYQSERTIQGRTARFCNVHNWKVLPEYRPKAFMLMRPAIALKDHTLTDLSAGPDMAEMMLRFGFQVIDSTALVLPQLPWRKAAAGVTLEEMTGEPAEYAARLSAADLRIYEDHRAADCGHLLVSTATGYCYIVYSKITQRLRPHCYAHFASDTRLLAEHHAAIRSHLLRKTGTRFVVFDARLVSEPIPYSFRVGGREKLIRPCQTEGRDVDTLYTEIVFLKHSAFSSLRPRLLTAASRKISSALGRAS